MTAWRIHTATLFYSLLAALPGIDLFLDVGSFDGREAFTIESRFPGIKVIAIEPDPHNIAVIQAEIAHKGSRVGLETFAVGNENATTSFYVRTPLDSNKSEFSSLLQFVDEARNDTFVTSTIEVPLCRLDTVDSFSSYTNVAMWMDVEGVGYQVLEGLAGIAQKVQLLHIEVESSPRFAGGKLAPDIMDIMSGYGFELIGSNLDKSLRRPHTSQGDVGDMVFLRKHSLSSTAIRQAVVRAWIVENLALQRLPRKVLPAKLYNTGRDWFVQTVASR